MHNNEQNIFKQRLPTPQNRVVAHTVRRTKPKTPAVRPLYLLLLLCAAGLFAASQLGMFKRLQAPAPQAGATAAAQPQAVPGGLIVYADAQGHYRGTAEINGTSAPFIVDTGATFVSIPKHIAAQAGLRSGEPVRVSTAGGEIIDHLTAIDRLKLGNAELTGIAATITDFNQEILIGMSALKYFTITQTQGAMRLVTNGMPSGRPVPPEDPGNAWANAPERDPYTPSKPYATTVVTQPPMAQPKAATGWSKSVSCDANGHCQTLYH